MTAFGREDFVERFPGEIAGDRLGEAAFEERPQSSVRGLGGRLVQGCESTADDLVSRLRAARSYGRLYRFRDLITDV